MFFDSDDQRFILPVVIEVAIVVGFKSRSVSFGEWHLFVSVQ